MNDKENEISKWVYLAQMDSLTAQHLNQTLYPKPREIICYHCQQCVEKYLKGLILKFDMEPERTHDLGILVEKITNVLSVPTEILISCAKLTQYGVKIRYPQEFEITDSNVNSALEDMLNIENWVKPQL